jgi:hypothetical protein
MVNTLVNKSTIHNGLQSFLFVGRDEHGPLRTHRYRFIVYKGV